jgi:hypothetical protein
VRYGEIETQECDRKSLAHAGETNRHQQDFLPGRRVWPLSRMRILMTVQDHGLVPGQVSPEQFDLLLAGTSIRGVGVIAALRDHLVEGLSPKQAWEKHTVNPSQFSLRLDAIRAESARVSKLCKFYVKT